VSTDSTPTIHPRFAKTIAATVQAIWADAFLYGLHRVRKT